MGGRADASISHSSCRNAVVAGAAAGVATGDAGAMAGAVAGDVGRLAVASAGAAGVAHSSAAADKTSVITRLRFRRLRLRCRGWAEFALPGRLLLIWGSVGDRGWTVGRSG